MDAMPESGTATDGILLTESRTTRTCSSTSQDIAASGGKSRKDTTAKRKSVKSHSNKKKRKKEIPRYRLSANVKEDHGKPLYAVQFNPFYENMTKPRSVFATAGSNRITVYECKPDGGLDVLQAYIDPNQEELYYTCAWSQDPDTKDPILAAGGKHGVIRILRPASYSFEKSLIGHGQAINELRFHITDPNLLLSISGDHALRLWNLKTGVCVVIFGGEKGHRDEVLSADFNLDGTKIVSCGIDHSLKIWDLNKANIKDAIKSSYSHNPKSKTPFKVLVEHFPIFSTCAVHRNYVDCVRWLGDLVLSKSTDNQIVCWKPGGPARMDLNEKRSSYLGDTVTILQRFEFSHCDIWYLRFCMDRSYNVLAVGNQEGKVFLWDLKSQRVARNSRITIESRKCKTPVRQIAMNKDASVIVYVCDDGTVWRWDKYGSVLFGGASSATDPEKHSGDASDDD
eukprot:m.97688 g.97688  ORF g.97688 m.97688 type:complete len:454 (+) comp16725_c0_seq1:172-1533(+)